MEQLHGIVLAGGQSRRMKEPKELLLLHNEPVLLLICRQLLAVCERVTVVTADPSPYSFLPSMVRFAKDIYQNCGPVGGIHAGMEKSNYPLQFVIACDYPFVRTKTIMKMVQCLEQDPSRDGVVPIANEKLHPLYALYRRRTQASFEQIVKSGRRRMMDVIEELNIKTFTQNDPYEFLNMNTPVEYARAQHAINMNLID
ncbi:molybdenum cofactor guanylyltransferase [Ammoniphilus resinae]|uniref:Probable molybdenum cofactor guanylyltransferase n=1 Tax=Ammoniphilus resinae TaxID=861532 RepID=A0ABS4GWC7_9BACL|nr:molybdenum cofactor guanylyltransferase [Ammoniphilus resinae]MBP1934583.1 molybdopterin-guanine dinucleotide biosynthesis protein A [Ammoniphilus resinae]